MPVINSLAMVPYKNYFNETNAKRRHVFMPMRFIYFAFNGY